MAQDLTKRGGRLAALFPVEDGDQILLVTDQGQLIRTPVSQVRMAGRNTQGVIIFRTAEEEHVVSVERLADSGEDEDEATTATTAGPTTDAPRAASSVRRELSACQNARSAAKGEERLVGGPAA